MYQYLRGLAIGTLVWLTAIIVSTRPEFGLARYLLLQGLLYLAVEITGMLLTSATGILGLVISAQRGQRLWGVALLLLLLLSAYTPLLYEVDPQAYYAAFYATFKDPYIVSLLDISLRFLPSAALAVAALAYGLLAKPAGARPANQQDQTPQRGPSGIGEPLRAP